LTRTQQDLIAELNHRVRNSLNLIAALVNQARDEAMDQQEFRRSLSSRIKVCRAPMIWSMPAVGRPILGAADP
jgi:hypothetical protein